LLTIHHQERPASTGARHPSRQAADRPGGGGRPPRAALLARLLVHVHDERGDVPGWVLVTAMTVALVMMIWGIASSALQEILSRFLDGLRFGS
jgi:hypothetical protein